MFDKFCAVSHTPVMFELRAHADRDDPGYPLRPAGHHDLCMNRHHLDRGGWTSGFDHALWLSTSTCKLCRELKLPRATWFEVDLRFQHEEPPTNQELHLVAVPPAVLGGVGQIVLQIRGRPVADLDVRMCHVDERGVIEHIRVDDATDTSKGYRRRGFGSLLVAMALSRGTGYRWSTSKVTDTIEARAFWARQDLPERMELGEPFYCSHMKLADGEGV